MPSETFQWTWPEAFDKFGFGDGNNPCHTFDVSTILEGMGYWVTYSSSIHNPSIIYKIAKDGVELEFSGDTEEDDGDPRQILPKDVIEVLDKEFPE